MRKTPHCVRASRMPPLPWYRRCLQGETCLLLVQLQHGFRYDDFRFIDFRPLLKTEQVLKVGLHFGLNFFWCVQRIGPPTALEYGQEHQP